MATAIAQAGQESSAPTPVMPLDEAEELFSADASSQAARFLALITDALLLTPSRLADESAGNERD
jgi:hypothetical protein